MNSLLPRSESGLASGKTLADALQQIAHLLGRSDYADRFVDNRIDVAVLQDLTDQDLKDLGVMRGDRTKMPAQSAILVAWLAGTALASQPTQKTPLNAAS